MPARVRSKSVSMDRVETKVDGIAERLDRMEPKLDIVVERSVRTEEMAQSNKATIKIVVASILSAVGAAAIWLIKIIAGGV